VLRNLLENALPALATGRTVNLRAELASDTRGSWLECSIEDDGPGFQPQDLPHLFEPFFTRRTRNRTRPLDRPAHRVRTTAAASRRATARRAEPASGCGCRRPRHSGRAVSAAARPLRRAGALATAAVVLWLALLEAHVVPSETAQRWSDALQLVIAIFAALACFSAARRPGARAFWTAFGCGCLAWATGQGSWVVRGVPFELEASYAEADLAFTTSTALFVVAFVLRPDRRDHRRPLLVIDVLVVLVAMLYLFFQVAYVHLALRETAAYEAWSTFLYDFRGLALLPALLWALHFAEPAWRPLYARLAPAFILLQLGAASPTSRSPAGSRDRTTRASTTCPGRCRSSGSRSWRCATASTPRRSRPRAERLAERAPRDRGRVRRGAAVSRSS
jgi:hypothetical protein